MQWREIFGSQVAGAKRQHLSGKGKVGMVTALENKVKAEIRVWLTETYSVGYMLMLSLKVKQIHTLLNSYLIYIKWKNSRSSEGKPNLNKEQNCGPSTNSNLSRYTDPELLEWKRSQISLRKTLLPYQKCQSLSVFLPAVLKETK